MTQEMPYAILWLKDWETPVAFHALHGDNHWNSHKLCTEKRTVGNEPDTKGATAQVAPLYFCVSFILYEYSFAPDSLENPGHFYMISHSQHSFAPAGMASLTIIRFSFSSPCSVWTAESSIPQLSWPIIFLGGRLVIATSVLPMRSSGL